MLGLSGGIDSALVAYLVAEAIGAERLLCVMMPYRTSSPASRADAEAVVAAARLRVRAGRDHGRWWTATSAPTASPGRAGAERSTRRPCGAATSWPGCGWPSLYDRSVTWRGLVVGTGNKTESLIGYTTLFGDSACAFNPIGDLYKSQVRQLAAAIGVPEAIIRKAPSADLWPGQTDEAEAGFTYPELDRLLFWRVDRRRTPRSWSRWGSTAALVERVDRMVAGAEFKRQVPPIAKLGPADGRRRLPVPAAAARVVAALTVACAEGPPARTRRRAARCTSSRRRSGTWATSRSARSRSCARCRSSPPRTRGSRAGSSTATRSRPGRRQLPRPERPGPRARAARAPRRRRGPRARHRRRHARGVRSRRGAGGRVGGDGGRVVPIPGRLVRARGRGVVAGSPGRAGRSRGSCPQRPRAARAPGARSPRTSAGAVLFEAPGRLAATLRRPRGGVRRRSTGRRLPGADEAPRAGGPRARWASLPRGPRTATIPARGEVVIVVGWGRARRHASTAGTQAAALEEAQAEVERLVSGGVARGEAARRVSASTGIPRRSLYGAGRGA